jgi:hypothetical protein
MRYQLSDSPVVLEAKARAVKDWQLNTTLEIAGDTPVSPVAVDRLDDEIVTVRLVPYAHTRLRITLMPWTGEAQTPASRRPDEGTILFPSVIVPLESRGGAGIPQFSYTVDLTYDSPSDLTLRMEINRQDAGLITLKKGTGTVTLETELLSTSRHNRVAIMAEDGSALPADLTLALSVGLINSGVVRYEAEKAKITGSATRNATHVGGIDNPGTALTFEELVIDEDGDYTFRFYYAAPMGLATHTVYVDGVKRGVLRYNENGKSLGWGSFSEDIYTEIHLTLTKGTHTLRIEKTADDIGFAELDAFDRIPCALTGGVPTPSPQGGDTPDVP